MSKSGNRIHGSLRAREVRAFGKKSFLLEEMDREGWELVKSDVIDAGEWNERRNWIARKGDREHVLCSNLGRVNWGDATEDFFVNCLGMSRREFHELSVNFS